MTALRQTEAKTLPQFLIQDQESVRTRLVPTKSKVQPIYKSSVGMGGVPVSFPPYYLTGGLCLRCVAGSLLRRQGGIRPGGWLNRVSR